MGTIEITHAALAAHIRMTVMMKGRTPQTIVMPANVLYKFLLDKNEIIHADMRPLKRCKDKGKV